MFETRTGATVRRLELRARNTEAGLEDSACFEARSMPRSLTKDNEKSFGASSSRVHVPQVPTFNCGDVHSFFAAASDPSVGGVGGRGNAKNARPADPPRPVYGKLYFIRHDPQPEAGLKNMNTPDAEMLCPTRPTLETYITKGANQQRRNHSLLLVLTPSS
eukprot:1183909-Prorocentrum_minimum.AAC.1